MKKKESPPIYIEPKTALGLLEVHLEGKKKRVHTVESMGFGMAGCDMDLTDIKKLFKVAKSDDICLSGSNMRSINHGVALFRKNRGWLFISSNEVELKKFEKELVASK